MKLFQKLNDFLNINNNIPNDEKFKEMSKEELTNIASILTDENKQLKEKMNLIMNENNLLKNSIINNSNEKNSEFGKIYNDLKETFLNFNEDDDNNNKNLNNFKTFLYNQFLFYGGIEEDDVNFINQININNDQDWEKNHEIFLFKQKILERNYNEMFRNLLISKEINNLIEGKKNINNNFNKENKFNVNQMKQNEEKIIKENNNNNNNNFNNNFNNNNFNNNFNNNNFNNLIKEEKVFNEENLKNSSNKNENKNKKTTNSKINNSSSKKANNDILYDLIYEDEDEKLSFSNLTEEKKKQKSKWDEE